MNPQMLMFAMQALQALPGLLVAGQNVLSMVNQVNESLAKMQAENRDPTPDEWALLNTVIADLRTALHSAS